MLEEPIPEETKKRLKPPLKPKPYQPIAPPRKRNRREKIKRQFEILRMFDPLHPRNQENEPEYQLNGRRYIEWRFTKDLEKDLTPKFMQKLRENVRTLFFMRHSYGYRLRNIETGDFLDFYRNPKEASPLMYKIEDAEKWLMGREAERLDEDRIERPNTKWVFDHHIAVFFKVIKDRKPLVGTGPLPDWLRNRAHAARGQAMVTLDTYRDNLCLWRCIAVHRGARPDRSTEAARRLAKNFFKFRDTPTDCPKTSLDELEKVEMHLNKGTAFSDWLGIRVYVPERVDDKEVVWHLTRNPATKLKNIMTIGIFGEHAFLIKDIAKLANLYACVHCNARFTQATHL